MFSFNYDLFNFIYAAGRYRNDGGIREKRRGGNFADDIRKGYGHGNPQGGHGYKLHIHCVMNSINYLTGLRLNNRQGFYEAMYKALKSQMTGWQWKGVVYNDYQYE